MIMLRTYYMHVSKPIGDSSWGVMLLRIPFGLYFVMAGLAKLEDPIGFVEQVKNLATNVGLNLGNLANIYGVTLPYIEIAAGGLLVVGLWTTLASTLTSLLLVSYIMAFGIHPTAFGPFNKDLILLGASMAQMYLGGGALSIDRFRYGGAPA